VGPVPPPRGKRPRPAKSPSLTLVAAASLLLLVVTAARAATIVGTAGNDILRGTPGSDSIAGGPGNDKLYGLGGADKLVGGPGNDLLVGGPGNDVLKCGPGRDVAIATRGDVVAPDCEVVKGIPDPTATTADANVVEGNSGTTTLVFRVQLSAPAWRSGSVAFATADGTAQAGSDYQQANGTIRFKPGDKVKTIDITIIGDTALEPNETLTLTLSNPLHVKIGRPTATGTIVNDDVAPPPAKPGHYAGTYTDGTYFRFDVDPSGRVVTDIDIDFNGDCPGYGTSYGSIIVPGPYNLQSDGSLAANGSFTDSGNTAVTFAFAGKVNPDGSATGSATIGLVFSDGVSCTSRGTWSAHA
jgi:Ca2+-binding RTX toxin-like protein